jgi:PPM family protein phosphatase
MTGLPHTFLFGEHSDPGLRDTNQDTVLSTDLPDGRRLVAVADGMGGLAEGERAGKVALTELYRSLTGGADLERAVQAANQAVHRESKSGSSPTGTTLVAAILDGRHVEIANVGDSRAYHLDTLGLLQITRDHTLGEEAIRKGEFIEEGSIPSRWSSALARFLGAYETVQVELFAPMLIREGDWLLLCSDGLHRVLSIEDLEAQLNEAKDPKQAAVRLVEEALAKQAEDNVSVALVYFPGTSDEDEPLDPVELGGGHLAPRDTTEALLAGSANPPGGVQPAEDGHDPWRVDPGGEDADPSPVEASSSETLTWNPGTMVNRSPRSGSGQRGPLVVALVAVGVLAFLVWAFLALNRTLSS